MGVRDRGLDAGRQGVGVEGWVGVGRVLAVEKPGAKLRM